MVPDPDDLNPQGMEECLGFFDHFQFFQRNGVAERNAAGEAGHGRFPGCGKFQLLGKLADLLLGDPQLQEGRSDPELACGNAPGR